MYVQLNHSLEGRQPQKATNRKHLLKWSKHHG